MTASSWAAGAAVNIIASPGSNFKPMVSAARAALAEQQLLEGGIHRGLAKQDLDAARYWTDLLPATGRPAAYDRRADRFLLGRTVGAKLGT